ncbi:hypothetical protein A2U01_0055241, partial [Trifolium medium]|nr:hypothetical protein [Trifolium medium]
MVVHSDDNEKTKEEQSLFKRKRTEQSDPENMDTEADTGNPNSLKDNVTNSQAQTSPISSSLNQPNLNSNSDLDTVAEGIKLAAQIHQNKINELASLLHPLAETQTQSQQSSPLQILEQL